MTTQMAGWFVGWMATQTPCWFVGWLTTQAASGLIGWMTNHTAGWSVGWLTTQMAGRLLGEEADSSVGSGGKDPGLSGVKGHIQNAKVMSYHMTSENLYRDD